MDTTQAGLGSLGVAEVGGPGGLGQGSGAVSVAPHAIIY